LRGIQLNTKSPSPQASRVKREGRAAADTTTLVLQNLGYFIPKISQPTPF
jgi:hypothetical protein